MAKRPASTSPFAHLAKANAEDDDDTNKTDAKAEGEQDDDDGDEDEGDEKETTSKRAKGKKAKADSDGDDDGDTDDEEDEKDDQAKAARSRERARCAAIFASPSAARNLPGAAHLAFNTSLPRSQAVGILDSMTPAAASAPAKTDQVKTDTLRSRMGKSPFRGVSAEAEGASAPARAGQRLVAAQVARKGGK
ncbi:hypothetical protein [Acetobacter persici]|uniref:hypothetical protein n=1 Tax=Acetobacter persici TaxID=1076596 RepID=UPI001BADD6B4|nr:hypothetical protein [Acetobacter persici]MBS1014482.1 hypothetical protein [Acetobacter persici]